MPVPLGAVQSDGLREWSAVPVVLGPPQDSLIFERTSN